MILLSTIGFIVGLILGLTAIVDAPSQELGPPKGFDVTIVSTTMELSYVLSNDTSDDYTVFYSFDPATIIELPPSNEPHVQTQVFDLNTVRRFLHLPPSPPPRHYTTCLAEVRNIPLRIAAETGEWEIPFCGVVTVFHKLSAPATPAGLSQHLQVAWQACLDGLIWTTSRIAQGARAAKATMNALKPNTTWFSFCYRNLTNAHDDSSTLPLPLTHWTVKAALVLALAILVLRWRRVHHYRVRLDQSSNGARDAGYTAKGHRLRWKYVWMSDPLPAEPGTTNQGYAVHDTAASESTHDVESIRCTQNTPIPTPNGDEYQADSATRSTQASETNTDSLSPSEAEQEDQTSNIDPGSCMNLDEPDLPQQIAANVPSTQDAAEKHSMSDEVLVHVRDDSDDGVTNIQSQPTEVSLGATDGSDIPVQINASTQSDVYNATNKPSHLWMDVSHPPVTSEKPDVVQQKAAEFDEVEVDQDKSQVIEVHPPTSEGRTPSVQTETDAKTSGCVVPEEDFEKERALKLPSILLTHLHAELPEMDAAPLAVSVVTPLAGRQQDLECYNGAVAMPEVQSNAHSIKTHTCQTHGADSEKVGAHSSSTVPSKTDVNSERTAIMEAVMPLQIASQPPDDDTETAVETSSGGDDSPSSIQEDTSQEARTKNDLPYSPSDDFGISQKQSQVTKTDLTGDHNQEAEDISTAASTAEAADDPIKDEAEVDDVTPSLQDLQESTAPAPLVEAASKYEVTECATISGAYDDETVVQPSFPEVTRNIPSNANHKQEEERSSLSLSPESRRKPLMPPPNLSKSAPAMETSHVHAPPSPSTNVHAASLESAAPARRRRGAKPPAQSLAPQALASRKVSPRTLLFRSDTCEAVPPNGRRHNDFAGGEGSSKAAQRSPSVAHAQSPRPQQSTTRTSSSVSPPSSTANTRTAPGSGTRTSTPGGQSQGSSAVGQAWRTENYYQQLRCGWYEVQPDGIEVKKWDGLINGKRHRPNCDRLHPYPGDYKDYWKADPIPRIVDETRDSGKWIMTGKGVWRPQVL